MASVRLNLLENSHAFLREAVGKALAAQQDLREWQFAIVHLVQAMELSLKAALQSIHPVLIYDNLSTPNTTVTTNEALGRLQNPAIGALRLTPGERQQIEDAIKLRNKVVHSDFELEEQYAVVKFFEVFAYASYFQARHLHCELESLIPANDLAMLFDIEKAIKESSKKARDRIDEESIGPEWIWACPTCGQDTFVAFDGIDTCYTCRQKHPVVECPHCDSFCLEGDMESFLEDLDPDYSEGEVTVHDDYGHHPYTACPTCLVSIREDIENQRQEAHYQAMEEHAHFLARHREAGP